MFPFASACAKYLNCWQIYAKLNNTANDLITHNRVGQAARF